MADPLTVTLGIVFGVGGPVAGIVTAIKARADAAKIHASAEKMQAEAELIEARTMENAQKMIAAELGEAKGNYVKAAEQADAATRRANIASALHADCTDRLDKYETEHVAKDSTIRVLNEAVGGLSAKYDKLADQVRHLTPQAFPTVKDPTR